MKLLSVDGIAPTLENIANGSYPIATPSVLIAESDDPLADQN